MSYSTFMTRYLLQVCYRCLPFSIIKAKQYAVGMIDPVASSGTQVNSG